MSRTSSADGATVLAVIPARGGSRGVKRKNLRMLASKPLIAWTIEAALASRSFDRVIVSTEDAEIAVVARRWGAEVPFSRPAALARQKTPSVDVLLQALQWLETHEGYRPEYVMMLQPTSPLRTSADILAALTLARRRNADAVVSVCPAQHHPWWMRRITAGGRVRPWMADGRPATRRQDALPVYALNGAVYLARRSVLLAQKTWYTENTLAYRMPCERSIDIDTAWDLRVAELILKDRQLT